jgi:hypothetical protein
VKLSIEEFYVSYKELKHGLRPVLDYNKKYIVKIKDNDEYILKFKDVLKKHKKKEDRIFLEEIKGVRWVI